MALAKIYMVRHGETEENRRQIIQGQLDTSLNEVGIEQAKSVAEALRAVPFDVAYSSDLSRVTKTVEAILKYHPRVELQKQEELRERYMGEYQGKAMTKGMKLAARNDSTVEPADDFISRVVSWWTETLQRIADAEARETPYHILVTSHGGVIGTLVKTLIQSGRAKLTKGVVIWRCYNASITILEVEHDKKATVLQYSAVDHLMTKKAAAVVETNADEVDVER